jgi:methionyl-tRNA synthetase
MKNAYITTPIYYVNDVPHIGHCYTSVASDVLARGYCILGYDVRLQTGTDEHGQKIEQSAEKKGVNTMLFCNDVSQAFRKLCVDINMCSAYDKFDVGENFNRFVAVNNAYNNSDEQLFNNGENFIRTTEGRDVATGNITADSLAKGRHIKSVQKMWKNLHDNGWIYKDKYCGWYAVRDEAFYDESEIVDGKAPSGAEVSWREEEAYFFRLSEFQAVLLELYFSRDIIKPDGKKSEVVAFVSGLAYSNALAKMAAGEQYYKDGALRDLCVSRVGLKWGIPVEGEDNHVIYVWLDALTNYISAIDYASEGSEYEKYWHTADNCERIHVIGKDILRFHAVYWPAFLIASNTKRGDKLLVANCQITQIFAHGWWTNDGEKISKSLGNVISPSTEIAWLANLCSKSIADILAKKNLPNEHDALYFNGIGLDYFRYFLLRAMPLGNDGDYSRERLVTTINSDLVNNIGNLANRVLAYIRKNFIAHDIINTTLLAGDADFIKQNIGNELVGKYQVAVQNCTLHDILSLVVEFARIGNEFAENSLFADKNLTVDDKKSRLKALFIYIAAMFILLRPVAPFIAEEMLNFLGISADARCLPFTFFTMQSGVININGTTNTIFTNVAVPILTPRIAL